MAEAECFEASVDLRLDLLILVNLHHAGREAGSVRTDRRQEQHVGAAVALLDEVYDPARRALHLVQAPDEVFLRSRSRRSTEIQDRLDLLADVIGQQSVQRVGDKETVGHCIESKMCHRASLWRERVSSFFFLLEPNYFEKWAAVALLPTHLSA